MFDNIPLTKLALEQGGYDWGALAYAVGFGGSMIWFGSSAGVAVSNLFPEAKSVVQWLREGWHVAVGYVVGFIVLMAVLGWHPHARIVTEARPLTSMNSASTQWKATGIAPSRQKSAPFADDVHAEPHGHHGEVDAAPRCAAHSAARGFARAKLPLRTRRFHATTPSA